jgi:hypothetical protein
MFRTLKFIVYYCSQLYRFYPLRLLIFIVYYCRQLCRFFPLRPLIFVLSHKRRRWFRFRVLAKFAGSHPAEAIGYLGRKKSSARLPSEGIVKPSVPCRSFTACKSSVNVTWKSAFTQNYRIFLAHKFHLPPLGALA